VWLLKKVEIPVHRLGLTGSFEQFLADPEEKALYDLYRAMDNNGRKPASCPRLFYPLPYCLRIDDPEATADALKKFYTPRREILSREQIWKLKTSVDEEYDEERGLAISKESHYFRIRFYHPASVWIRIERESQFSRHLALLTAMVQGLRNGSHQVVVVLAFLALTDKRYSGDRVASEDPTRAGIIRILRNDIYRYLAKAFCGLHACLDLPLACLEMMKRASFPDVQLPPPCVSDRGFTVLVQMEIYVTYGLYAEARDLFWKWHGKFPSASTIHEELVMLYCAGIFHVVQELLVEIRLTEKAHRQCSANNERLYLCHCWLDCVLPMVRTLYSRIFLLQSLLHRCLSDFAIRGDFRLDLHYALAVATFYQITAKRISIRYRLTYDDELEKLWNQLHSEQGKRETMSSHLAAFQFPLSSQNCQDFFRKSRDSAVEIKDILRFYCHVETPRIHADNLFTILTGALFHQRTDPFGAEAIRETLEAYRQSTGGRHHRILLLNRYLTSLECPSPVVLPSAFSPDSSNDAWLDIPPPQDPLEDAVVLGVERGRRSRGATDPEMEEQNQRGATIAMKMKKPKIQVHPFASRNQLSSRDLTSQRIRDFAVSTMSDCLGDFASYDLGCPEKFCRYLRERDDFMPAWIDSGLKCCRFASQL
jgi:hypothetical protein